MTRDDIIRIAREAGSIDSEDVIQTVFNAFVAAEREACAKVCDRLSAKVSWEGYYAEDCAAVIRARGEK